jgi:hypothetical protein
MRGTPGKFRDDVYVRDGPFTDVAISEFVVTSDGLVLAQEEGDVGANAMIGEEADPNRK